MMYDRLLYFAVAVIISYGIYYLPEYIKKRKRRRLEPKKTVPQKNPASGKVAMLCRYSGQQLRLNVMALEAMREMSVAAAKSSNIVKIKQNRS